MHKKTLCINKNQYKNNKFHLFSSSLDHIIYNSCLGSIYFWNSLRQNKSSDKFVKLYHELMSKDIIFPKNFEFLQINENYENDLEVFEFENHGLKIESIKESIGIFQINFVTMEIFENRKK